MAIQIRFQEMRSNFPTIFIVTPYDVNNKNSPYTWNKPNIQLLYRTVVLAKDSLMKLKNNINNYESSEHLKVFMILIIKNFIIFKLMFIVIKIILEYFPP